MNNKRSGNIKALSRILKYLKPHTFSFLLSVVLTLMSVILTLLVPIVIGDTIDMIVGEGNVDFASVTSRLFAMALMTVGAAVLQWIVGVVNNRMTYGIVCKMRTDAFEHLQTLPVSYIDRHGTGPILSRIISDVDTFSDGLLMGFTQLCSGIFTIIGTLVLMMTINVWIALIVVILTPASMLLSKFIAGRTFRLFRAQAEARETQTSLSEEVITSERTVKAFMTEQRMIDRFEETNERLSKASVAAIFYSSLVNPSTRFLNGIIYAVVALTGSLVAIGGGITVGGVTCFLGYANQYTKPFNEISGVITEFQNALACAARISELLDEPSEAEVSVPTCVDDAGRLSGDVKFDNVSFSYDPSRSLIKNFNIGIKPGQKIAIVGPTGCGKTTLINLLMRFYDVNSGAIRMDGVDIRDIPRRELRRNYGMVLQDTWIKSATVAENIALGRPDASREEIIEAAGASHADKFIRRLPGGYDAVLGEDGGALSAGQKQLLSIARIMLCLPPVLILDEATSSIDIYTESKIQDSLDRLMRGRTSFVVAHRLTTVQNADMIIVMRDGHIEQVGTHDELVVRDGLYAKLYRSQFLRTERES